MLISSYEREQPPIVAEGSRQQWQALKNKLAILLKFTEDMRDEICTENGKEDQALLNESKHASRQRNANETA